MGTNKRYQIIEEIGRGAMGIVFRGKDPKINRDVALKCLRPHILEAHESAGRRFEQEIRALGRLIHPNIVTIFDVWEDHASNNTYIVMEYVEGTSLAHLIKEKTRFTADQIVHIGVQVCNGLHFAHTKEVIHRDIKPGNILLSADFRTVKITDFGIARLDNIGLTQSDHLAGTPQYMSPEQCRGELLDGRSDLFAVGALLYELLTQQKAFHGESVTSIMHQILNHSPYAPYLITDVANEALSAVVMEALEKDPDDRFSSGLIMADALRVSIQGITGSFPPYPVFTESMTEHIPDGKNTVETQVVSPDFTTEETLEPSESALSSIDKTGHSKTRNPLVYLFPAGVFIILVTIYLFRGPSEKIPVSGHPALEAPASLPEPEKKLIPELPDSASQKQDKKPTVQDQVKPEKTAPLVLTGQVVFATTPEGADIAINGIFKGISPMVLDLPPGPHDLVVSKKGFHALEATIDVPSGEKTPLNLKLLEEENP